MLSTPQYMPLCNTLREQTALELCYTGLVPGPPSEAVPGLFSRISSVNCYRRSKGIAALYLIVVRLDGMSDRFDRRVLRPICRCHLDREYLARIQALLCSVNP
jgi:hypothetical protein